MSEHKEYIERGAAMSAISTGVPADHRQIKALEAIPAADVVEITRDASKAITHLDSCRVLTGEWSNRFDEACNILYDADGNEVITIDRLRELAAADREGRVVVLPCKAEAFKDRIENIFRSECPIIDTELEDFGNCNVNCFDCYTNAIGALAAEGETE